MPVVLLDIFISPIKPVVTPWSLVSGITFFINQFSPLFILLASALVMEIDSYFVV